MGSSSEGSFTREDDWLREPRDLPGRVLSLVLLGEENRRESGGLGSVFPLQFGGFLSGRLDVRSSLPSSAPPAVPAARGHW